MLTVDSVPLFFVGILHIRFILLIFKSNKDRSHRFSCYVSLTIKHYG